ncbi:MAG: VWA domain-containing protein [Ruminococcaceae bacterium]|nr:VWA domain-containing protein [Oscillospiraceae bacterium]
MKRMNVFSKIVAFILAVIMVMSFAACNSSKDSAVGDDGQKDNMNGGVSMENSPNLDFSSGNPNKNDSNSMNSPSTKPNDGAPSDPNAPSDEDEGGVSVEGDLPDSDITNEEFIESETEFISGGNLSSEQVTEEDSGEDIDKLPSDYEDLLKNSFTFVRDQAFSTFSSDVDTASYTYFRKLVSAGYSFDNLRNSGGNFRIEEFINYFRYDVDQPKEGELFGVKTELVPCPWNDETMLFRVTLQAENAKPTEGNNLVFLIDVSGSMSGADKLPLLKKAFSYLVGNLGANDTVSIVTYSGREEVVLEGCNGLESDKIMNAINGLVASGSTNGEAGLTMAYRLAEKYFIEGGNNRIIMASDGDLNVGISSESELTKYIEEKRDQGVYLSVLGFGTGNYHDANMEALADNGNGVYYYIDGESEAEKVFGTDLASTMYTVANDVKLQVEFDPDMVQAYRLIGYDNRILDKEDFENDAKDAGDVGASHQVTVVYEIKPIFKSGPVKTTMMTLRVRYKNPGESLSLLNEYAIGPEISQASNDMRFITAVIETAALLRNRDYNGTVTLASILGELDQIELNDSYKAEFCDMIRTLYSRG